VSKDADAKTLVAMAIGSGLVVARAVLLDGLTPGLAKQSNQVPVLAELAASPKLYAENPHGFAGSNYEIFSNPTKVAAALAMFAATFGPLADGFGYEGFDTFRRRGEPRDDGSRGPPQHDQACCRPL
jgi:hypothetical protein